MSDHTPGPWKFDGSLYITHGIRTVAIVPKPEDVHLIAAAPELKDIVKEFVEKAVIPIRPPERDPSGEVIAVLVRQWVGDDLFNRAQSLLRRIEGEEV